MTTQRSGLTRRRRILIGVVTGAALLGAAGAGAASVLKSPAQVAAETAPPSPDTLTAPVEKRVLSETLITRGTVTASQSVDVAPGAPAGENAGRALVTKVGVKPGDKLAFGRKLVEISGRPLFVLKGALPAYRDLGRGSTGEDVQQLQRALAEVGHGSGTDRTGTFGAGTENAVRAFYTSIGYAPVLAGSSKGSEKDGAGRQEEGSGTAGPLFPLSEVVYLRSLPARVDTVSAVVGEEPGDKLLTISAGTLMVKGSMAPHEKGLVHAGQKVEILSEALGRAVPGSVVSVSPATAPPKDGTGDADGQAGESYEVAVKPDKSLPAEFSGQDVRLTIAAKTTGDKVLSVPASAISAGADGRTTVTVREPDGERRRVVVRPGMSGDGYVHVTPEAGSRLTSGEQVVVGVQVHQKTNGTAQ